MSQRHIGSHKNSSSHLAIFAPIDASSSICDCIIYDCYVDHADDRDDSDDGDDGNGDDDGHGGHVTTLGARHSNWISNGFIDSAGFQSSC